MSFDPRAAHRTNCGRARSPSAVRDLPLPTAMAVDHQPQLHPAPLQLHRYEVNSWYSASRDIAALCEERLQADTDSNASSLSSTRLSNGAALPRSVDNRLAPPRATPARGVQCGNVRVAPVARNDEVGKATRPGQEPTAFLALSSTPFLMPPRLEHRCPSVIHQAPFLLICPRASPFGSAATGVQY